MGARSSILTPAVMSVSDVRVCVCACCLRVACCIPYYCRPMFSTSKYAYSPDGANLQLYEGSEKTLVTIFCKTNGSPVVASRRRLKTRWDIQYFQNFKRSRFRHLMMRVDGDPARRRLVCITIERSAIIIW